MVDKLVCGSVIPLRWITHFFLVVSLLLCLCFLLLVFVHELVLAVCTLSISIWWILRSIFIF